MPEVYNWQLGRKMLYPYEERHPKWQFAFVFNINRCIACQTCSMADKSTWLFSKGQEYMWWNNVETKPYGGYPQFYARKGGAGTTGRGSRRRSKGAARARACRSTSRSSSTCSGSAITARIRGAWRPVRARRFTSGRR